MAGIANALGRPQKVARERNHLKNGPRLIQHRPPHNAAPLVIFFPDDSEICPHCLDFEHHAFARQSALRHQVPALFFHLAEESIIM